MHCLMCCRVKVCVYWLYHNFFSPFLTVFMADTCRQTLNLQRRTMTSQRRSAVNLWQPRTNKCLVSTSVALLLLVPTIFLHISYYI